MEKGVRLEIPMPNISDRQVLTAQDPLATVHQFQVPMRVVLPSLSGMRMCFFMSAFQFRRSRFGCPQQSCAVL
eukprot:1737648-Karenia_brevis.AAC.1